MKYIIALLAALSTTALAGPRVTDIQVTYVTDRNMYITDRDRDVWLVEHSCDLDLTQDSGRATLRSNHRVLRPGSNLRVDISGVGSQRCRVLSVDPVSHSVALSHQE